MVRSLLHNRGDLYHNHTHRTCWYQQGPWRGFWRNFWIFSSVPEKRASDGKDTAKFGYIQMFRVKFDDRGW